MSKYYMSNTSFHNPSIVTQVVSHNIITGKPSISWSHTENITSGGNNYAITDARLYTISGFWAEKFKSETNQLMTTGYGFADTGAAVLGIELELNVQRVARIEDLVVQLILNDELVGDNLASTVNPVQANAYTADMAIPLVPVNDYNIYGGPDNLWGRTWTSAEIADPSFGVAISFKSNDIIPHNDLVYLTQVGLRITYA